jgi:hypothetical protein
LQKRREKVKEEQSKIKLHEMYMVDGIHLYALSNPFAHAAWAL